MNINGENNFGLYPSVSGNTGGLLELEQKLQNFTASVGTDTNIGGTLKVPEIVTDKIYDLTKSTFINLDDTDISVFATNFTVNGDNLPNLISTNTNGISTINGKIGQSLGIATLTGAGKLPISQLPLNTVVYCGTWNASTNTPTITTGVAPMHGVGCYYVVNVSGSTDVSGVSDWQIGDWIIWNGDTWQKVDHTDQVTAVNGLQGSVVLNMETLNNVDITSLAVNEILKYDGNTWINNTLAEADIATATNLTLVQNKTQNITAVANNTTFTGNIQSDTFKLLSTKMAIGSNSGITNQGNFAVALGLSSGNVNQGSNSVAIGREAGNANQGPDAISIGTFTGKSAQGPNSIAIGTSAGQTNQGFNAIAIGNSAGFINQRDNSIVINASSAILNGTTPSALYINPIRENNIFPSKSMNYNPSSKEITYGNIGNYIEASKSTNTTINSSSEVIIDGMSITPVSGTYMATFSCWLENDEKKEDDGIQIAIYIGNNIISHSIRRTWTGEEGKYETSVHTQAIVFATPGSVISVKGSLLGNDRIKISNRSLTLVGLGVNAN